MALEDTQSAKDTITLGAMRLADLINQGYTRDEAEMMIIRANRGAGRQEELRERSASSRTRGSEQMLPEEEKRLRKELKVMGIDLDDTDYRDTEQTLNASQLAEYGQDQADMQNPTDDDKDFEKRASRRLKQQAADKSDLSIRVGLPNDKGRIEVTEATVPAGQPIPRELREEAMLQEMGLSFPERRKGPPRPRKGKDGVRRTQYFIQGKDGEKRELPAPSEPFRVTQANASGVNDAYQRLVAAVESGEVSLDDPVQMGTSSPYPRRNVSDVLESLGLTVVPQQAKQAEQLAGANAVESSRGSINQEVKLRNEKAAQLRAMAEGAKQDMFADERIGRISEISQLGSAKGVDKTGRVQTVTFDNPVVRPDAIQMIGPNRNTVGYINPETQEFLGEVNSGSTSNALNAPKLSRTQQFALENVYPNPQTGSRFDVSLGQSFGPPDFEIMGPSRAFVERASGLADLSAFPSDIRSAAEADAIVSAIIESELAQGRQFFTKGADGKQVLVENPGIADVLTKLRYTDAEKSQLARSIFALEELRGRNINSELRQDFEERRRPENGREVMFEATGAQPVIGKVGKNEKVGGKGVGAELRKINEEKIARELDKAGLLYTTGPNGQQVMLPEAREILSDKDALSGARIANAGVAPGETAERPRFLGKTGAGMTPDERIEKYGGNLGGIANEVERRYQEDRALREQAAAQTTDPYAERQRALDSEFKAKGVRAERDFEDREIARQVMLMQSRGLRVPPDSALNQNSQFAVQNLDVVGRGVFRRSTPQQDNQIKINFERQPITQAATPMSIAPTPGDVTGNQSTPALDAGRGGWMGGSGNGRIVSPWSAPEPSEEGRPLTPQMKAQLDSLTPKSKVFGYMTQPDGPTKERERRRVTDRIQRDNLRRRGAYGAAGAGAVAGLAALIGGEREQREEEAMI